MIEKKKLITGNQEINYIEGGNGKITILMIHGNSLSGQTFEKQFKSDLVNDFHLIAMDLPGCGKSEKAKDKKQYSIQRFSNLVSDFITKLELDQVVICGHSLGGHIALETMEKADEVKGVFIFGTPPLSIPLQLEQAFLPHAAAQYLFAEELSDEALKIILDGFFSEDFEIPDFIKKNLMNADGKLRSGLLESAGRGEFEDELKIISSTHKKVAILHAENDKLVNGEYFSLVDQSKIWENKIHYLEKGGHFPQMENPEEFNKLLFAFCKQF